MSSNDVMRIKNIRETALQISKSINILGDYNPKPIEGRAGEALFWCNVTNYYGLLYDSDRIILKSNNNLIKHLKDRGYISEENYRSAVDFYRDVSCLRKVYCHNQVPTFYYDAQKERQVKNIIKKAFIISTSIPDTLHGLNKEQWGLLNAAVERGYDQLLDVLEKGLISWRDSTSCDDEIDEFNRKFAEALFGDNELIDNVLAMKADYLRIDGASNMKTPILAKQLSNCLKEQKYTEGDIYAVLTDLTEAVSKQEIILQSMKRIVFEV